MRTTLKLQTYTQEEYSVYVDCRADFYRSVFKRIEAYSQPPSDMKAAYIGRPAEEKILLLSQVTSRPISSAVGRPLFPCLYRRLVHFMSWG